MSLGKPFSMLYKELMDLPENKIGEIISGELIVSPRPGGPHAIAASALGMEIGPAYHKGRGGPGGWWIVFEPELHLSNEQVLVPDIAGWRRDRMPIYPDDHRFTTSPDWVCEVFSPTNRKIDRVNKMPIYAANGVRNLWFVDPAAKMLESYQLENSRWVMMGAYGEEETVKIQPFDGISITIGSLWE